MPAAGKMAPPRATTNELKGSAPAGEDRAIRETCRVTEKVTETVTREKLNRVSRETCRTRHEVTVEKLNGVTGTCTAGREVTELTETREITREVVERLHGDVVKDAHTHTHTEVVRDNGGELAERVGTRCEQLVSLPREQGEGVCPLEAGLDQVDTVVPREVEEVSAADGCTQSLGGVKTPGALVEASVSVVPSVSVPVCAVNGVRATLSVSVPVCAVMSVVPVCVVSRCAYTSVFKCVLRRTHSTGERRCVRGASSASTTPCANESPWRNEPPCASESPCASGVVTDVPACVLPGTPCVKGAPQLGETMCAREAARVCEPPCVDETPRVSAPAGVCV